MKTIVLGSGVNALGMVRSLGEAGHRVVTFAVGGECPNRAFQSRYVEKVHCVPTVEDEIDVLLRDYGHEKTPPVILCGSDEEICLLDRHYDALKDKFRFFNAGSAGRITHFLDKANVFPLAARNGLTLIKTWRVTGGEPMPDGIAYPCLTKGANSTTSTKGFMAVCADEAELRAHLRTAGDYLVQEYVEKDYELDVIGFSWNHGADVSIRAVVRKVRETLYRQSDCICLQDVKDYPQLPIDGIKGLVREIGYEGIFSVEFLAPHGGGGGYLFLEINLRNDGCGWLYTKAGLNYPALWVAYAQGTLDAVAVAGLHVRAPLRLVQIYDVKNVLDGKIGFGQWLREAVTADAHFTWDWKDPMPFVGSTWTHLRRLVRKIVRTAFRRG